MDLKNIIQICFSQGKVFYTHPELEELIKERYGYNLGRYINSRFIRRAGIKDCIRKVAGSTVRGFWLEIKDYSIDQIKEIYNSTQPSKDHHVYELSVEVVEKKIRFLMRDWDLLPQWVKMDYKKHKDGYLKEVLSGTSHKTEWFYSIIRDLSQSGLLANYEGKDIDFKLAPIKDIIKHLNSTGAIKNAKTFDLDKAHFILTNLDFVRINEFVYGKLIVTSSPDILPDW
jgi:hypothetical protein